MPNCYILDLTDIRLEGAVMSAISDFRKKVFDPLRFEVQEKLEKTEKMYSLCVEMLAKGNLSLTGEAVDNTTRITPPRKRY